MTPRFFGLSPAAAAAGLLALLTGFRLLFAAWLPLVPDEAYYWQWSRHLDASYFSKGPAVAWTIRTGTLLFGDNVLGIRFFAVLLSAGTAWQIFLLARRWYDDATGLIAVLLLTVVPLYQVGAVLMTIDPLSVFFWVWAAGFFSRAVTEDRLRDWMGAGFAVGCGFLAKYLNALELAAFIAFLLVVARHRTALGRPGFWCMLGVAVACSFPVWWWNAHHHWISAGQLIHRGALDERFSVHPGTLFQFAGLQALMISPLLFLCVLAAAVGIVRRSATAPEGELLLLLLFLVVFVPYAILSLHVREEANWPAVSYLGLIIVVAARGRAAAARWRGFVAAAYLVAWVESLLLYSLPMLPLSPKLNPASRLLGWQEIARHVDDVRRGQRAGAIIGDGYKEASMLAFYLPAASCYTKPATPPATQYDFWPGCPTAPGRPALWMTADSSPAALAPLYNTIDPLDRFEILDRGQVLRSYTLYRCENR